MIAGVGVDFLKIKRIKNADKAFFKSVYTKKERAEAKKRENPLTYYATRFAGKEAIFKCLGRPGTRLNEIEILTGIYGEPIVTKCPVEGAVHISLTYEDNCAAAFAVLEKSAAGKELHNE